MTIDVIHDPAEESISVSLDYVGRNVLAETARLADDFCQDHRAVGVMRRCSRPALDELMKGRECLRQLSRASSTCLVVEVEEASWALNLACFMAGYYAGTDVALPSLSQAVLLLANLVPYPVQRRFLPPVEEVLPPGADPETQADYESIRLWDQTGPPHLFLYRLYQLGRALTLFAPSCKELNWLRRDIEMATDLFRFTMQSLALAELGIENLSRKGNVR